MAIVAGLGSLIVRFPRTGPAEKAQVTLLLAVMVGLAVVDDTVQPSMSTLWLSMARRASAATAADS